MNSRDDIWDDYAVRAEVERQAAKQDADTEIAEADHDVRTQPFKDEMGRTA